MQTLQALYLQNPFWVWLAVGAVFVGLDIAVGSRKLIWGGAAAAVLALLNLAGVRVGLVVELFAFAGMTLSGVALSFAPWRRRSSVKTAHDLTPHTPSPVDRPPVATAVAAPMDEDRSARLVGRIARTTTEFANGVGRVFIDGVEWAAELDGEDSIANETPVRIIGVTGGIRLQVRDLMRN